MKKKSSTILRILYEEGIAKLADFVCFFIPGAYYKSIVRGKVLSLILKKSGRFLYIDEGVRILHPYNLSVEDNVYFARNVWINANYNVYIGSNVKVAPMTVIATGAHNIDSKGVNNKGKKGAITIGSNVWISSHCTISAGVKIGNNVIVAANSVVLNDVPDNTFVAGVPAKIKKGVIAKKRDDS